MTESKTCSSGIFENGLSYLSVPGPPLSPLTLGQLVDEAARKWTNSEFLYDVPRNRRLNFGQLKNEVDLFASGLLKIGLRKGDRLGILGGNSCRWIITFLAAAKIGVIIIPLSIEYEAAELLYALNYMSVKCLVVGEPVKTRNLYQVLKEAVPDMEISMESDAHPIQIPIPEISSNLAPHLKQIVYMGNERIDGAGLWTEVQTMGKDVNSLDKMKKATEAVQFDDILYTPFTSGTTGRSKGAMISHHSLVNVLFRLGNRLCLTPQDRKFQMLPLFHAYGCIVSLVPLCFGSSVVIPSPTFSPSTAIKIVAKEKCTWLHGTPTMYYDMMNTPGFDLLDLSPLRGAVVTGASVAKQLVLDMAQKYGLSKVTVLYGSTEGNVMAVSRFEDPPEVAFTSVGYPLENTEFKIIDARGRIVPVGETGEICCRSFGVMRGYWEDPEKTKEAIDSSGWFHTGDAGQFLKSGHFAVVGRFKDVLIRGGENIYPKEIEDFLYQNLSEEIVEVHVFGVADERLGEVVAAWILTKRNSKQDVTLDTAHVKRVCEGKISRRKIPEYIKFLRNKDEIPRTSIGKAQKTLMRQQYEKELGLLIN